VRKTKQRRFIDKQIGHKGLGTLENTCVKMWRLLPS